MRRNMWLGLAVTVPLTLAACAPTVDGEGDVEVGAEEVGGETGGGLETEQEADGEALQIAFVSHTQDTTDLFGQMKLGFEAALEEQGVDYELIAGAPPNSEDHAAMDRILTDVGAVNPDYIVMGPTSYELNEPRLVDLENAGTKIVMTDYEPPEEFQIDPLTWVVYSHEDMGEIAATTVAEQHCESADGPVQIALFWGPVASEVSQQRGAGILRGLEQTFGECGVEYQIVEEVYADFNRERAYNLMETVATAHPDMDIAFGFNSNTALGMSEALITAGRADGVDVVTMGGQPNELAALCRGEINNSVFRDPWDMGELAADAIVADMEGGSTEDVVYTALAPIEDCDDVFESVPRDILEQDEFRGALPEELWQEES